MIRREEKGSRRNIRKRLRSQFKLFRNEMRGELHRYMRIRPANRIIDTFDEQAFNGGQFLVATKNGFYCVGDGETRLLLDGQFYGVSFCDGLWYVFQRLSQRRGRIIEFSMSGGLMLGATAIGSNLDPGCHQIDFAGHRLLVTDTYNNRLLVMVKNGSNWELASQHYPPGELSDGRNSANYAHMNSIWAHRNGYWVVFHNETSKSGRNSELVKLDERFEITDRIFTSARNAHNVAVFEEKPIYCDSNGGQLMHGDVPVYESEYFLRGLSITEDLIVVGQSQYGQRIERDKLKGSLAVLSNNFQPRQVIKLPGMVQEIRSINSADICRSNSGLEEFAWSTSKELLDSAVATR